uniref:Guanylate kinase-like domain-containing protein n=1 Tax=Oryza glumipatula TaxID=40148 RepID=A0A0E0BTD6_9ORYZ
MCKQGKSRFWSGVGNSASSPLPLTNDDQIHRIPAAASTSTPSPAPPHQIPPPIRSSPLLHRRRRRPPPASDPLLLGVSILGRVSRPPRGDQEAEDRGGATRIGGASALITAHFMGEEAPEFRVESVALESKDCLQNAIDIGDKTYVISRSDDPKSSITIKILDKLTQTWVVPTVLGAPPNPTSSHSAVLVNNEKILIIEKGVPLNDSIWFLEVDTPFVKQQSKIKGTVVVAWSKGVIGEGQKPIVISGPSGVGKGTLIAKLMKEYPSKFGFSVSHTTRAPREKEIDGVHYHFTERSKIEEEISEGKFLEFAHVHGNVYGTSIEAVESVTDEGKEQIQKRLRNARAELDQSNSPGLFDHLLVNDDLEACYENLKKLLSLDDDHEDSNDSFIKDGKETACYSILSKTNSEILLQSETNEAEKGTTNLISLDLSSLSGGAPGRTRGLKISPVN